MNKILTMGIRDSIMWKDAIDIKKKQTKNLG